VDFNRRIICRVKENVKRVENVGEREGINMKNNSSRFKKGSKRYIKYKGKMRKGH
jgi:hypothetical protein